MAVKLIWKKTMEEDDFDLIRREIEILKLCQHPNIIRLIDVFESSDFYYIVMELLKGGDLSGYWEKRNYRISEMRTCTIIHSLATALYYLHHYGIVHRDLKLDNILMADETEDSDVKIVDFGLSKMIGPGEKCKEPYGTLGYAAPEIFKGKPYDKSVDVWSLGMPLKTVFRRNAF